ncbi:hypothetical protein ERO13_D06G076450v2 [Gossypium hirsutum]|uniref:Uncharacterized protein n=1 Tax=Gossypium barbadense TaxID=3634 RepID=A0A5J5QZQ4_GOSBA|nr:hypothetical protein ES319_D06G089100v1 [Gossypium barbadense]KAG4141456.1 hypothetical protein ERO13_D06G076450v2 [Gossypium hirsutum]
MLKESGIRLHLTSEKDNGARQMNHVQDLLTLLLYGQRQGQNRLKRCGSGSFLMKGLLFHTFTGKGNLFFILLLGPDNYN